MCKLTFEYEIQVGASLTLLAASSQIATLSPHPSTHSQSPMPHDVPVRSPECTIASIPPSDTSFGCANHWSNQLRGWFVCTNEIGMFQFNRITIIHFHRRLQLIFNSRQYAISPKNLLTFQQTTGQLNQLVVEFRLPFLQKGDALVARIQSLIKIKQFTDACWRIHSSVWIHRLHEPAERRGRTSVSQWKSPGEISTHRKLFRIVSVRPVDRHNSGINRMGSVLPPRTSRAFGIDTNSG